MITKFIPPSSTWYLRSRGQAHSRVGISTRFSSVSTVETVVPDVTKFDQVGKRAGMLFGDSKRVSLLTALGLGDFPRPWLASDYNSDDSDSDRFVVYYDALFPSPSSSRMATSGYNGYGISIKRFSAALTEDSHESDSSDGAPEAVVPTIKRGRIFDPKESQSQPKRDTIFDAFVLGGQVAPIIGSQGPWQDGYKKLVKSARPEPDSLFSARPKSGENGREYLFEYQPRCIKAPPLKPPRLRGSIPACTSQMEESKPTVADIESKENGIERTERGIESKYNDIEAKVNDSSIDSGLSDLFKDVEALYTIPTTPSDAKTGLDFDTVVPNGKPVPVSRNNGPRQDTSTNIIQKPGRVSTKPRLVLPLSSRRKSGSRDVIVLRMCVPAPDISVPFSIGEERSCFDGDDNEDEGDYALTVFDEDEEEVLLNPFEFDYVMDPVHQTTPEIEPATTDTVEDHKYDTENGQHDVWADTFKHSYFMSADHSTAKQSADEGNDTLLYSWAMRARTVHPITRILGHLPTLLDSNQGSAVHIPGSTGSWTRSYSWVVRTCTVRHIAHNAHPSTLLTLFDFVVKASRQFIFLNQSNPLNSIRVRGRRVDLYGRSADGTKVHNNFYPAPLALSLTPAIRTPRFTNSSTAFNSHHRTTEAPNCIQDLVRVPCLLPPLKSKANPIWRFACHQKMRVQYPLDPLIISVICTLGLSFSVDFRAPDGVVCSGPNPDIVFATWFCGVPVLYWFN
ncbi:hypothetical protein RhiJN_18326 [Ceratobasidium sp. AG-Ba]|nr:hypothetical protein RhiJN_18326 [Ceratobasidium sp. AG-Ba]